MRSVVPSSLTLSSSFHALTGLRDFFFRYSPSHSTATERIHPIVLRSPSAKVEMISTILKKKNNDQIAKISLVSENLTFFWLSGRIPDSPIQKRSENLKRKGGHLTKVHASSPLRVGVVSPRAAVGSYNSLLRTLLFKLKKNKTTKEEEEEKKNLNEKRKRRHTHTPNIISGF